MFRPASLAPLLVLAASCAALGKDGATTEIARKPAAVRLGSPRTPASFPYEDARTALRAAAGGLRSCSESAVPRSFEATLRFEPSGRVSRVDVSPEGGRVAACIRSRLGEVALRPFDGEAVTLRMALDF